MNRLQAIVLSIAVVIAAPHIFEKEPVGITTPVAAQAELAAKPSRKPAKRILDRYSPKAYSLEVCNLLPKDRLFGDANALATCVSGVESIDANYHPDPSDSMGAVWLPENYIKAQTINVVSIMLGDTAYNIRSLAESSMVEKMESSSEPSCPTDGSPCDNQ